MFFRDLKMKSGTSFEVVLAEARLPVRLGHRDAKMVFGDPMARQLAATGLGAVTDVRAHEEAPDDVFGVTLFLGLRDSSRDGLKAVSKMLEHLHAPLGSSLRLSLGGEPMVFGATEGLELSVANTDTPDAGSRRQLAQACTEAMKGFAISRGWAKRADRTIFYFYGESFQRMQTSLAQLLDADPIFASAVARRLA
ncbi:MAG: hypothetical protein ACR2O1_17405 [Boseongicola sp.]